MTRRAVTQVALVAALAAVRSASAQIPDLMELGVQYVPSRPLPGAAPGDPRGTEVQVSSYDASLNVPIVLNERTFLVPGAQYHVDSVSFSGQPDGFVALRAFHAVSIPVLFVRLLPRSWSLSLRAAPTLAGDFASIDSGALHASALALATNGVSDRLVLGFGGLASYSFGSLLPLPVAYVDWEPAVWLRVESFLPAFVHVDVRARDRIEVGPALEVAGNEYAVRDDRIRGGPACTAPRETRTNCMDHIAYSVATLGLDARVRVAGTLWVSMRAGRTVFRRFEQFDADDARLEGGLRTLPNAWLVRVALNLRIPMPQDEADR